MVGEMEEQIQPDWEMVEAEPRPPTPPTPCLPFSPTDIHMGIEQLEVQEDEEEDEEEEEEEGPPPGWNIIPQLQSNIRNENMYDDDDDGPPPGWDFTPKSEQPMGLENKDIEEERQPPGWHFVSLPESEIGNDHQDIEEEGPPPGWPSMPPTQQSTMIEKEEVEVGSELGSNIVPSPQIRLSSELEAVKDKEIGIQHEKSSIDLLQPILEYKQEDLKGAQPGLNFMPLPQPRVTAPMVPPSPLQLSDTDIIKSEQEAADEEGPPPGWHSVEPNKANSEHQDIKEEVSCGWMSPAKPKTELQKEKIIGAEEEGPSPGWNSIEKNKIDNEHQDVKGGASRGWTSSANTKIELEKQDIFEGADEEGPPPGWHLIEKNKICSEHQDIKDGASRALMSPEKPKTELEKQDIIDEGPPPGWNLMPPPQSKSGSENHAIKSEGPPHGLAPPLPKVDSIKQDIGEERPSMSNSVCQQPKMGHGQQEIKEERSQPGSNFMPPPSPQIQPPMPTTTPMSSASRRPTQSGSHLEMGQLVCGSCRHLLSYARGAKYVKCSCCQTVNLVLEAHQVGQVKCGGCEVLLMYQFGANAVQCASCRHLTEIVAQNRRPPLSAQQARGRHHGISNR